MQKIVPLLFMIAACGPWQSYGIAADQIYRSNAKSNTRLYYVADDQQGRLIAFDFRHDNIHLWKRSKPENTLESIAIEVPIVSAFYSAKSSKLYMGSIGKVLCSEYPFDKWSTLLTHQMHATAIAFDDSEKTMLVGFGDKHFLEEDAEKQEEGALQLVDLETNETILSMETADVVRCAAISGNGQLIAYVDHKDDVVIADRTG